MRHWPSSLLFSTFPLYFSSSAPCAPQDVAVDARCADGAMIVSWSPNPDAQYFLVQAVSNTGSRHHCNSSGTACIIRNLPCGQKYNVTVLSVRDGCESEPSTMFETSSGKFQAVRLLLKFQNTQYSSNVKRTWCTVPDFATRKQMHFPHEAMCSYCKTSFSNLHHLRDVLIHYFTFHSSMCAHECSGPSGLCDKLCLGDVGCLRRSPQLLCACRRGWRSQLQLYDNFLSLQCTRSKVRDALHLPRLCHQQTLPQ